MRGRRIAAGLAQGVTVGGKRGAVGRLRAVRGLQRVPMSGRFHPDSERAIARMMAAEGCSRSVVLACAVAHYFGLRRV